MTITFNNHDELVNTLSSIQDCHNIQSVVINGGSCEQTKSFLNTYTGVALSEKDRGISDAFNKGIRLSSGDAIMFLNSGDVLLDKNYIEWANKIFDENPSIDFTYSDIIFNDSDLGHVNVVAANSEERSLARGMPYPHQSLIIRNNIFQKIGDFDESFRFTMDFDLILRMKQLGSKGMYYSKPTVLMDGNGVSSNNDLKVIAEVHRALKKNKKLSAKILTRLTFSLLIFFTKRTIIILRLQRVLHFLKKMKYLKIT